MRRLLAAAVFGVGTVGAFGCAGNASYVKKFPDGGVIALKAGGDQAEVRKLIEKHVGPDFEVVDTLDPNFQPASFDPSKSMQPKAAAGEMHYVYKKKAKADVSGLPPAPVGAVPGNGAPAGGLGQAAFQQPAGGIPLGTAGMPAGGTSGFGTMGGMQPPDVFPRGK